MYRIIWVSWAHLGLVPACVSQSITARFTTNVWINRSISHLPQCIRQITHNASYGNSNVHICYKMVNCGIWDWGIVRFVQKAFWFIQHLFLVSTSKLFGMKRSCIKKTYTIEKEIRLLFSAKWYTCFNHFWAHLHKGPKWAFLTWYFFTSFLSSILYNTVGMPFLTNWGM